ncbi:hydroxyisourate hydrolase [Planctomycetes bacterium Pan216]|uniref:hydroxyisourate hydrolase n=1 Tax=Kolteria novifilia TaxID=2527975 RepID=UPI00119CEB34
MGGISTHILDTGRGRPASGVPVVLQVRDSSGKWRRLGEQTTDADGRVKRLLPKGHTFPKGVYRLTFDTSAYYRKLGQETFYPEVTIIFAVRDESEHFHVPLLLSPFGYSTYRGS